MTWRPHQTLITVFAAALLSFSVGSLARAQEKEKAPTWQKDVSRKEIPDVPAQGMIHGRKFTDEKATISGGGILFLRMGKEFFADLEIIVFMFIHEDDQVPGTQFKIEEANIFDSHPHIHMKYQVRGEEIPETETFMTKYTLRLELGKEGKEGIPGKIYLCLPDEKKSFVVGTFTAVRE